ncbi:MAG: SUMF1/EgtB/PvdO family nonheme iron enzyme [Gammaproteobacteria bacterium]|nr:SUMF1/EgtB/PvdO family nonheme iron enzyme [Gammaproteobacteria bacterium]MBU1724748.1 SUMF1/EgtB/PvdO family nonheme iron enzyme [Gammaproteobacteria bacterium]MBU2005919.1 SUMF1/EgtB/PvdO family nonheme iron enzyme [Gammaproteobacteria bacterium]
MAEHFLLDEFLDWLRTTDGLRLHVTLQDYRRIQQVLLTQGEWTHRKLQQVLASLLVHDREQLAAFTLAYRQFFAVGLDEEDEPVPLDATRLRADLQQLAQRQVGVGETVVDVLKIPLPEPPPPLPWWKRRLVRRVALGLLLLALLVVAGFAYRHWYPPESEQATEPVPPPAVAEPTDKPTTETITIDPTLKPDVPEAAPAPETRFSPWWWLLPLAGALFTAFAVWRHRQLDRIPDLPAALPVNTEGKAHFDPARIGGAMPEWLDKDTLDYCADSVGFFLTEEASHEPDMPATIRATVAAGGVPEIRLLRRKQLFHLLILTDVLEESSRWNPLAEELADGLRRRGLPVTLGRLRGGLREFHTDEGQHMELLELAEERGRYVTLVFADASLPDPIRDRDLLNELRLWPQLGWLTFREPRHWGRAEQRLQQHGIHLWEASPVNLPDVFRHLAGEMLRNPLAQVPDVPWRKQQPQEPLTHYLPRVLGDALPLARLAALFPPPVSPALLVRLLQTFYPRLPLTRLQRLYRLPGTQDAGGLSLSLEALKLLRGQFYALHNDSQRRRTIDTLLAWMQEAEPLARESPAWWGWRWRYARLLAELDVDRAYPLLEEVERAGVLAEGLAADLDSLPVTALPKNAETLKSLYQLGRRHGFVLLEKAQVVPQAPFWSRSVWVGSVVTAGLAVVVGVGQFWPVSPPQPEKAEVAAAPQEIPPSPPFAKGGEETPPDLPEQKTAAAAPEETPPDLPLSGEEKSAVLPQMVKIVGGTFQMGCVEDKNCQDDEKPVHSVTVADFEMGVYEVTNAQYVAFLNAVGQRGTKEQPWFETKAEDDTSRIVEEGGKYNVEAGYEEHPAINISWYGAKVYLDWLSKQTKQEWRLPTEAEWEYATRAGTKTAYSWGDQEPVCDTQAINGAQFGSCKENAPVKVGSFKANKFGLHDVHGNAWEWVEDCFGGYDDAPTDGTARPVCDADASRVLRGGSWHDKPWALRASFRYSLTPATRILNVGFRAARTINPVPFTEQGTADQVAPPPQQGQAVQATLTAEIPSVIPIPAGEFTMGCEPKRDDVEGGCADDEKPPHKVSIKAFSLAATEVTVKQFRAFVEATSYQTTAEKEGSCYSFDEKGSWSDVKGNSWRKLGFPQTDNDPVACISWEDAQAYLKWLSAQTKQIWRLPTEAEWEYAARGGNDKNAYSWGQEAAKGCAFANMADQKGKEKFPDWTIANCNDGFVYTSPVGSFKTNGFGLFDMHGNVYEWVEDCWQSDYKDAPVDGAARQGCDANASRVLRGGSWNSIPRFLRASFRYYGTPVNRNFNVGFRAARTN